MALMEWENNTQGRQEMLKFIDQKVSVGYKRYNEGNKIILEKWEHGKVTSRRRQFVIELSKGQLPRIVCNPAVKDTCTYKLPWEDGSPRRIAEKLLAKGEITELDMEIIRKQYTMHEWLFAGD